MAGMEFMASNGRSAVGRKLAYCLALLTRSRIKMITAFHCSSLRFAVLSNYVYFDSALLREPLLNLKLPRQMYIRKVLISCHSSSHHYFIHCIVPYLNVPSYLKTVSISPSQCPTLIEATEQHLDSTIRNPHHRHASRSANAALFIRQLGSARSSGHDVYFSVSDALEVLFTC